jgi:sodium-independent sulfate anion transporter 11
LWYLSISRNALIVLIASVIAFNWSSAEDHIKLTGQVKNGIPSFRVPDFEVNNENQTITFIEIVEDLGSGLIFLPLVAVLANVAIAKAFSKSKYNCSCIASLYLIFFLINSYW